MSARGDGAPVEVDGAPAVVALGDRQLANFLVYDVLQGALSRKDTPPEQRRPFYVFFDEVQTYDGAWGQQPVLVAGAGRAGQHDLAPSMQRRTS